MKKKIKKTIQSILFLVLGAALFYWAIGKEDVGSIWNEIEKVDTRWVALSIVAGILSHLFRALRWNLLLEPMGYKARAMNSFHAVILGYMVNFALPRVGEITRPAVLGKLENIPVNKLIGTVVVERVVDLIITILIAVGIFFLQLDTIFDFVNGLFADSESNKGLIIMAGGLLFLTAAIVLYRYRQLIYQLPIINKFKDFLEGILDGFKTIFHLRRKTLFIVYSLLIWLMYFFMPYFILFAVEGTSHLGVAAGLTILFFGTAAMIVPVPGGVGTFEFLVPAALALYGVGSLVASSYTLITHAIQFLAIMGVGVFSIISFAYQSFKIKRNGMESTD